MRITASASKDIPRPVLETPVKGRNLAPGTFGDQLRRPTLLVFLRHLG